MSINQKQLISNNTKINNLINQGTTSKLNQNYHQHSNSVGKGQITHTKVPSNSSVENLYGAVTNNNASFRIKPKPGVFKPSCDFGNNHSTLFKANVTKSTNDNIGSNDLRYLQVQHQRQQSSNSSKTKYVNNAQNINNNMLNVQVSQQYYLQNNSNNNLESTKVVKSNVNSTSNKFSEYNPNFRPSSQQQFNKPLHQHINVNELNSNTSNTLIVRKSSKSPNKTNNSNMEINVNPTLHPVSSHKQITVKINPNNCSNNNNEPYMMKNKPNTIVVSTNNKNQFKKASLVTNIKNLNTNVNNNEHHSSNNSVNLNYNKIYSQSKNSNNNMNTTNTNNTNNSSLSNQASSSSINQKPNFSTGKKGVGGINYLHVSQVNNTSKGVSKLPSRKNSTEKLDKTDKPLTSRVDQSSITTNFSHERHDKNCISSSGNYIHNNNSISNSNSLTNNSSLTNIYGNQSNNNCIKVIPPNSNNNSNSLSQFNLQSYSNRSNLIESKSSLSMQKNKKILHKNISNEEINSTNFNAVNHDAVNNRQQQNNVVNNNNNNNTNSGNVKTCKSPTSFRAQYRESHINGKSDNKLPTNISNNSALMKIYNKISTNNNNNNINSSANTRPISNSGSTSNLHKNNKSLSKINNNENITNNNNNSSSNVIDNQLKSESHRFSTKSVKTQNINIKAGINNDSSSKQFNNINYNNSNSQFSKNSSCKNIFNNQIDLNNYDAPITNRSNYSKNNKTQLKNNESTSINYTGEINTNNKSRIPISSNSNNSNLVNSLSQEQTIKLGDTGISYRKKEDEFNHINNTNNNRIIVNSKQTNSNIVTGRENPITVHSKNFTNNNNNIEIKVYKPSSLNNNNNIVNTNNKNFPTHRQINSNNIENKDIREFALSGTAPITLKNSPKNSILSSKPLLLNNNNFYYEEVSNKQTNKIYLNNLADGELPPRESNNFNNNNKNSISNTKNNNINQNNYYPKEDSDLKSLKKSVSNSHIKDSRKTSYSVMNNNGNNNVKFNQQKSKPTKSNEKQLIETLKINKMKSSGMNSILGSSNLNNINNNPNSGLMTKLPETNLNENKQLKEIIDLVDNELLLSNSNKLDESLYSVIDNQENQFKRDSDRISKIIRLYYNKKKEYPETCIDFYRIGRLLGRGAFGKVNLGVHSLSGHLVAIKSFNKSKLNLNSKNPTNYNHKKNKILYETHMLKNLRHKNIIQFYESFESKDYILIIMEYISCGDLLSYVRRRSRISENVAKFIFKQIIEGIQYIHSKNVVHRDIKLDNILIDLNNSIKICDFGVSKQVKKGEIINDQCGTPAYIAPEILRNNGYEGFGVDIWSAGVVLYTMLTGTVPFKAHNMKDLHRLILKGQYISIEEFNSNLENNSSANVSNQPISSEASNLIKAILEIDPKKRITVEGILNHSWIKSLDYKQTSKLSLFTEIEKVLLSKSKCDLRERDKNSLHENFTLKNLNTMHEKSNENNNTKSFILAPFNSSIHEEDLLESTSSNNQNNLNIEKSFIFDDVFGNNNLVLNNKIVKFVGKVRELNKQYELDHNQEMDGGKVIISPMQNNTLNDDDDLVDELKSPPATDLNDDENEFKSPSSDPTARHKAKSSLGVPLSDLNHESSNSNLTNNTSNNNLVKVNNGNNIYSVSGKGQILIRDEILKDMEKLGYSKSYVTKILMSNELNYSTTCYYLLMNSEN